MGLGLLLVGILAGAAGAQVVPNLGTARFLNSGLFNLAADEQVNFNLTLDDARVGPPVRVVLQLFNEKGAVVKRLDVPSLVPGQSAILRHAGPGVFRAHAETFETSTNPLGPRRIVVSTVEILGTSRAGVEAGAIEAQLLSVTTPRRFVCSTSDGGSNDRLPDLP